MMVLRMDPGQRGLVGTRVQAGRQVEGRGGARILFQGTVRNLGSMRGLGLRPSVLVVDSIALMNCVDEEIQTMFGSMECRVVRCGM